MTRILVVGDCMTDQWVRGDCERLNPESALPLMRVQRIERTPGGAANVAANVAGAGATPILVGHLPNRKATTKTRVIAHDQQICRYDDEDTSDLTDEQTSALLLGVEQAGPVDGVICSDYRKGVLKHPTTVREILRRIPEGIPIVVDTKGSVWSWVHRPTLIKLNLTEFCTWRFSCTYGTPDFDQALLSGDSLMRGPSILVTAGAKGAALVKQGRITYFPAGKVEVADPTGAGDVFTAYAGVGLAKGWDLETSVRWGLKAAERSVSKPGTVTITEKEVA